MNNPWEAEQAADEIDRQYAALDIAFAAVKDLNTLKIPGKENQPLIWWPVLGGKDGLTPGVRTTLTDASTDLAGAESRAVIAQINKLFNAMGIVRRENVSAQHVFPIGNTDTPSWTVEIETAKINKETLGRLASSVKTGPG